MEEIKTFTADDYERARIMIEETRLKCQATLISCGKSIESLNVCRKTISDTKQGIDDFQTKYKEAMDNLCSKLASAFKPLAPIYKKNENNKDYPESKLSNVAECVEILKGKKKIVFLTGAGISVASGIPSFRGVGAADLFQKNGVTYKNEEIATVGFMKSKPELFWERHLQFVEGMKGKQENISHRKIQELREFSYEGQENEQKQQVILVTQNIDGLHKLAEDKSQNKKKNLDKNYFEIHGNKNYLRCDNDKCQMFDKIIDFPEIYKSYQDLVCLSCKEQLRPNVLYFDESYDEIHYRTDTLRTILEDIDALVCVGTMLETGFAANMVTKAIEKKITVVEINLTPVIEIGGLILNAKSEDVVPAICDGLMGRKNQEKPKEKPKEGANIPNKNISVPNKNINNINKNPTLVKTSKITAPVQPKGNQKTVPQKKYGEENKKK